MQRSKYLKSYKKTLCILILFIMIYTMFSFAPQLKINSYAKTTTYTYTKSKNDLPENFDTTYPGYKKLLQTLTDAHPNWTFKLYETGLNWDEVINSEYLGHGSSPKNLVPNNYGDDWICSICGKKKYDNGSWYCASREAIEYLMDPRNSLNETYVFQHLLLSNDKNITKEQVASMAKKIDYLNDDKLINAIYEVANDSNFNINPFYIIGKILQEQGSGASALCSGKGYKNEYVGYYNLFNVKASGNTESEVILNGLKYAKEQGWDTPQKSIMGGLGLIKDYINRGQDTLYYQKYNVVDTPYYQGQYAQNIFDAQTIGLNLRKYYNDAKLLEGSFIFEIPLYKNMPSSATQSPTLRNTTEQGELAYINAEGGLSLRSSPNGKHLVYVPKGTEVLITERAKEKVGGYYWDKVVSPLGTGYMAREAEDGSKVYLVVKKAYEVKDDYIVVAPGATLKSIEGATSSSKTFGTGAEIEFEGKTYTLVVNGDCDGDGKINSMDMYNVIQHILNKTTLKNEYFTAVDINSDKKIDSMDMYNVIQIILKG